MHSVNMKIVSKFFWQNILDTQFSSKLWVMVHSVAFCRVEERTLQHFSQACLPPPSKLRVLQPSGPRSQHLTVTGKIWKLMWILYLKFSLRDIVGCVYICAPDTLDVWHECLCLAHYVLTREAWTSWTPRHVNHNKLFLGATFYGRSFSLYFFTFNSFVSWPVICSISFSCRIVYITWRELGQNCSKNLVISEVKVV
jgi:hypothetical protein